MESVSLKEAQRLVLASQKLSGPVLDPAEIIEHLGYVQIDTISVVERAHHHVFWTRNSKYRPHVLDELVRQRKVFEYWSHAASYLPMSEYRYTLPMKRAFEKRQSSWYPKDTKLMKAIIKRIKAEGPLRSKDFERPKRGGNGWWNWKPSKKALERLFLEGKLEVTRREGFQKVYDLPENVIPSSVDTSMPTETEYLRALVFRTLRHHGLATADEIAYLKRKDLKAKIRKQLRSMVASGELEEIKVEGVENPYAVLPGAFNSLTRASTKLHILSPFDNLVIQRHKLKTLFNFDYQIECYLPATKRKYGYFTLPVFEGSRAIARIDCKADRATKQLIIHSMNMEQGVGRKAVEKKLSSKLKSFARFNGCESVSKFK